MSNYPEEHLAGFKTLKDVTDWNEGTVYKGYDEEELVETLTEDTPVHTLAVIKHTISEILAGEDTALIQDAHWKKRNDGMRRMADNLTSRLEAQFNKVHLKDTQGSEGKE